MYKTSLVFIFAGLTLYSGSVHTEQITFQLPKSAQTACQVEKYSRKINVGGGITREQAILHLKRLNSNSGTCILPIEDARSNSLSEMSVILGQGKQTEGPNKKILEVIPKGHDLEAGVHYYAINPPKTNEALILTINYQYLHLTVPKPSRLSQQDGLKQGMVWEGDLLGGFGSMPHALADNLEVTVKVVTPTSRVFSNTSPSGFKVEATNNGVLFTSSAASTKLTSKPQSGLVHYHQPHPVMSISNWTRLVEVSHWGNNVAIEDQIHLENRGPALKGSFSRVVHQTAIHARAPGATAHILTGLSLDLPRGVMDPYYIDTIGNVSTSRFRPSLSPPISPNGKESKLKKKEAKFSKLELIPRYPIAGGWNYSFVIGYNMEAGRVLKQSASGDYVLKVPFFTRVYDVPVDLATLRVRLPEGASNVKAFSPFPTLETHVDLIDKTYLDTTGRPTVLIKKALCTDAHSGDIYISYSRPAYKSFQKPLAIAGWMMTLFCLAAALRRFEWKIGY
ncbi:Ribophorin I [Melampsora americana]|nr:Ribophorin I [Melampsora americana]